MSGISANLLTDAFRQVVQVRLAFSLLNIASTRRVHFGTPKYAMQTPTH